MIARSLDEALAVITDGCALAVPREASGGAMAATRALIRRGVKRLHLIALPTSSLQADLLIGAGCVETIETSAVSLSEFGPAPRLTAAVTAGTIRVQDAACPMAHAAAKTVVTVEKLHEGNLFDDPTLAAGALGGFYIEAIAVAPNGAWPLALADHYGPDAAHLAEYARMAASADGFAAYLDRHVHAQRAA